MKYSKRGKNQITEEFCSLQMIFKRNYCRATTVLRFIYAQERCLLVRGKRARDALASYRAISSFVLWQQQPNLLTTWKMFQVNKLYYTHIHSVQTVECEACDLFARLNANTCETYSKLKWFLPFFRTLSHRRVGLLAIFRPRKRAWEYCLAPGKRKNLLDCKYKVSLS